MTPHGPLWQRTSAAWLGTRSLEFLSGGDAFEVAPLYTAMREISVFGKPVSEEVWGVLFGLYALLAIGALYVNSEAMKVAVCLIGIFACLFFGLITWLGYWQATGEKFSGAALFSVIVGVGLMRGLSRWGRANV